MTITLEALIKDFGRQRAVDHLDLRIEPGKVTGFLGPNGAGKSTTMRMILGLDDPSGGRALIDGVPYRKLVRPLRTVGAHISGTAGHPGHTPNTFLRALAQSNSIAEPRLGQVLEQVGLAAVARRRIGGFSLGMRQRLGIAAALLGEPPVLIFDEPMNGLDADGITWIRSLMRERAAAGATVFVSSHLMSEVQQVADHLVLIGQGRLLADESTSSLIGAFGQRGVTVRLPQPELLISHLEEAGMQVRRDGDRTLCVTGAELEDIGRIAHRAGLELHELSRSGGTLEAAYSHLTRSSLEFTAPAATEAIRS